MIGEQLDDPTDPCRPVGLRELIDAIPDCVLLIDTMGVIRFLNRTTEEQLGYGPDWIGQSIFGVIHDDDLPVVLSSIESVQGKAVGTPVEVRVFDAGGGLHWYEEVGRAIELDDGSAGILCVARNITQRRMWEVAAGDVTRFQHLVQVSPTITLLLDGEGVVTSVNAAFTRLLGHDPSAVVGQPLLSFVDPDDVETARRCPGPSGRGRVPGGVRVTDERGRSTRGGAAGALRAGQPRARPRRRRDRRVGLRHDRADAGSEGSSSTSPGTTR
ncbi:MAG: PAS domain S-box protein [Ilumatobacteraceae bacterium]